MKDGYALVGRTFPAIFFSDEESAFRKLRTISEERLKFDGSVTIYKLTEGRWEVHYEPPIKWEL